MTDEIQRLRCARAESGDGRIVHRASRDAAGPSPRPRRAVPEPRDPGVVSWGSTGGHL